MQFNSRDPVKVVHTMSHNTITANQQHGNGDGKGRCGKDKVGQCQTINLPHDGMLDIILDHETEKRRKIGKTQR